jgi:hypothetical protein
MTFVASSVKMVLVHLDVRALLRLVLRLRQTVSSDLDWVKPFPNFLSME